MEREREVAENGIQVASCYELKEKVRNLLDLLSVFSLLISLQLESIHSNIEENRDTYVRFDTKILNGCAMRLRCIIHAYAFAEKPCRFRASLARESWTMMWP